jgi:hypothetical protein
MAQRGRLEVIEGLTPASSTRTHQGAAMLEHTTTDHADDKRRENRLRRTAHRQGLQLVKSRNRNPRTAEHGTFMLVDAYTNGVVASGLQSGYGLTLDDVERALASAR